LNRTPFEFVQFAATLAALLIPGAVSGADWPQFRGPGGQGDASATSKIPVEWDERKNVRWKTELPGKGHSSPVIWGDQVWVTTASPDGKELGAVGLDRRSGAILHNVTMLIPARVEEIHKKNSHASTTPVIEAGRLYAHFGTYGAAAVDTASGKVLWRNTNLEVEHQGGPGSSPLLFGNLLLVTCDGADRQYVAALDRNTGREVWRRNRSAPFRPDRVTHRAFATPLLIEFGGKPQLISPGADQLHAYDPQTGAELWHVRYTGFSTVPCPVFDGTKIYFCTGFFNPELWAVTPDGTGDVTSTKVAWKYKTGIPETPSPILYDGHVYVVSDKGVGTSIDAETGKRVATFRLGGNFSASPIASGGYLYFCSEEGNVRVVQPGAKPKIFKNNELPGTIFASPAAIGGELYLRTDRALYRIEETPSAGS